MIALEFLFWTGMTQQARDEVLMLLAALAGTIEVTAVA